MKQLRFHIPAYVHLPCSERYNACAFTQKVVKLSLMLLSKGHEVYIYGAEGSDVPCTEFIETHTLQDIRDAWGEGDNRFEIGYDWKTTGFRHDFNTERTAATLKFYTNCALEINKRKKPDDFLLLMQGQYHQPIASQVELFLTCEPGIGYRGSIKGGFRAFESSYLQNFTYGSENPFQSIDGSYYDRVIPNYFDPADFEPFTEKGDYFLYIGRMILRKGVWTAIKATEIIGKKLILAGQIDEEIDVKSLPAHCEFVGFADAKKRRELMSRAIATFVPSVYLESFGGTHIESMMSGTPAITTNFGVFPGTIPTSGYFGYRCNTLQDFVDAARDADLLKGEEIHTTRIRDHAIQHFSMKSVMEQYQKWFEDLYQLYLSATIEGVKGWHNAV